MTETINAKPATVNIKGLVVGDSFRREVRLLDGDYTTYTFAAKVERTDGTTVSFTVSNLTYATPNTTMLITLSAVDSATLTPNQAHPWDLQYTDTSGLIRTLIRGRIMTLPQVTT